MCRAFLAAALLLALPIWAQAQADATGASDEQTVRAARLADSGPALLEFFRGRARATSDPDKLKELIAQLGDGSAQRRDRAFAGLLRMGMPAVPLLRQAANSIDDQKASTGARRLLQLIEGDQATELTTAAARLLAKHNPEGTVGVLLDYLPFAEDDRVAREVESVLASVASSGGKLHPGLLEALKNEVPARRAVAAEVICRAGDPVQCRAVRPLLKDPKPAVRYRAALGLARRHDAEAVPVLIDLLADLDAEQQKQCEEFLTELAGQWAVTLPKGDSPFVRKLRREVWAGWWKGTGGPDLVEEFRRRTPSGEELEKALKLVKELGNGSTKERERAAAALAAMGPRALPLLRRATEDGNVQVSEMARRCVELIENRAGPSLPAAAARLLALRRPEGAAEALLGYAPFAEDDEVVETIREVLPDLVLREGKVDPVFLKALADPVPARRAVAAEALAEYPMHREAVRKLLKDADGEVRVRAALALASNGDREAVPALIALLEEGAADHAWMAEDYLTRLAGEKRPDVSLGSDAAARKKARAAWAAWWKENARTASLPRRAALRRILGYTLVIEQYSPLTRTGRVAELDAAGKVRWEVGQLYGPMDAQVIGSDRLLVAEHNMNRVTERDFKGNIKWQKQVPQPIVCERLRNGHTFIAGRHQLLEVDRDGREVVSIRRPDYILGAGRLRDGTFAFVTSNGYMYHRIDRKGQELKSFRVNVEPVGGSLYFTVLPSGHVLVGQYSANKVFEVDREGKRVWEARVTWPYVPTKMPNGNVIVASSNTRKVVELDRSGRILREIQESRTQQPYKAYRR